MGIIGFLVTTVFASFIEHTFHKYFLHSTPKTLRKNRYVKSMFVGHVVSHHANYIPDKHYTRDETNKGEVLTFSWYEGPLLIIFLTSLMFAFFAAIRTALGFKVSLMSPEVAGAAVSSALYYIAYEYLHALMHVPEKWKWLRSTKFMGWLNRHHYQHHIDPRTNLNVVLPIADYFLGTKKSLPKENYAFADNFAHD